MAFVGECVLQLLLELYGFFPKALYGVFNTFRA